MPGPTAATGWRVDDRQGSAGEIHARWPPVEEEPTKRAIAVCRVSRPSVVLGSTQPESVIDGDRAASAGVTVTRRRSGGGAVLVAPDDPVWIDVWLPRADPLWHEDVGRAFDWLGETWVRALEALGVPGLSAHGPGAQATSRWSGLVCFGGVGAGEVVTTAGFKVVGLAQRRNRDGALFQSACLLHWDAQPMAELLALPDPDRRAAGRQLADAARGVADLRQVAGHLGPVTPEDVLASFFVSLP